MSSARSAPYVHHRIVRRVSRDSSPQIGGMGCQRTSSPILGSWQPLAAPLERNDARYEAVSLSTSISSPAAITAIPQRWLRRSRSGIVANMLSGQRTLSRRLVSMSAVTISAGYGAAVPAVARE